MFPPIVSQDNRSGVIILTNFRCFSFLRRRANTGTVMSVWSVADPSCIKDGRLSQTVFDKALCLGGKQYPPVSLYGAAQHPHREEEAGDRRLELSHHVNLSFPHGTQTP